MKFKNLIYSLLFITTGLVSGSAFAQEGKVRKADKDFDRYGYIDAREIYLKVVEDGYKSAQIYENLGDTYYWNSDYDNAANWYGKLMTEFPEETDPIYFYRASQSFKSLNQEEKASQYLQMYVEKTGDEGIMKNITANIADYNVSLKKVSVNSSYSDFGPSFYKDKHVVFASARPGTEGEKIHNWMGQPFTDLFIASVDDTGDLSSAFTLEGDVNTEYHETSPTFTEDGKTMYFTRNNFIDGKKGKGDQKTIKLKIYKATLSGTAWTDIKELPFNSDEYSTAHPSLSADGKRLYFASDRPGSIGMSDIWYVDILGEDQYGDPMNLGAQVNTSSRESFPFISKSNMLYFASDGKGGYGGFDIFRTQIDENGNLSDIYNLGEPANSNKDDFGFIIDEEKHIGYVSSNRGSDEGSIGDDIYTVFEQCIITLEGNVFDIDSGEPIPGAIVTLYDSEANVIDSIEVGPDGRFSFDAAECDKQYNIRASKNRYEPNEKLITTPNKTSTVNVPMPLKLVDPCAEDDLGCRLKLQPIYFDFDRYNIRPDAEIELAKILAAMRQYPELVIHIESHTDSRGSDSYNEVLSEKRAQSTLKWLVNKGIDASRLSAKGYGEYQLQNRCSNGVECTEEEHQLNRRSMFIIQN